MSVCLYVCTPVYICSLLHSDILLLDFLLILSVCLCLSLSILLCLLAPATASASSTPLSGAAAAWTER